MVEPVSAAVGATVLNMVGFTASGVKAASIAASIQASIGNVAAGSLFAAAQSAGATGAASAFGLAVLGPAAVLGAAGAGGYYYMFGPEPISTAVGALALKAIGFTPMGIKAGSVAAAIHSTIGNVAGGSLFAAAQSAGATGAAAGFGAAIIVPVAVAGGGYYLYHHPMKSNPMTAETLKSLATNSTELAGNVYARAVQSGAAGLRRLKQ